MTPADIKSKVHAALALLSESSTTFEKARSVAGLVRGVNPKLDAFAAQCEKHLGAIETATQGDIITLAAGSLPEGTEEEKRRKKALLLFIKYWGELKDEVARVHAELESEKTNPTSTGSLWWRIFKTARGPLAVITVLAVGIALMAATSVDVVIKNEGCSTLYPNGSMTLSMPGLTLPSEPLPAGGTATATIPPLSISIDGTSGTSLVISSLKLNFTIQLSRSVTDIVFDGETLLGKKVDVDLGSRASHSLRLICGN